MDDVSTPHGGDHTRAGRAIRCAVDGEAMRGLLAGNIQNTAGLFHVMSTIVMA